VKAADIVTH